MCGICGIAAERLSDADTAAIGAMTNELYHRGPDDEGVELLDGVAAFGFRRLAILDLSIAGHQPMRTADGKVCIAFNGEIYNFVELRHELKGRGYSFRGHSDTEVILNLYREHGTAAFSMLNGMFAIALYDAHERKIILARDRMGKKPLFYWHDPGRGKIMFASETKAFYKHPEFQKRIDAEALSCYLRIGYVPNWTSIYRGVSKLRPGHFLEHSLGGDDRPIEQPYWQFPQQKIEYGVSEEEWIERIDALLQDATRIRLRSDVPLGLFLSAGIDSGLVASAAVSQSSGSVSSLTVGMPGWEHDEWPLASQVAQHLGIDAIHKELDPQAISLLPTLVSHFDEPFSDYSMIPTYLVCKAARESKTVVLSGDGGDELFAGYKNHVRAYQFRHYDLVPSCLKTSVSRFARPFTKPDSVQRRFINRFAYPVGFWGLGAKLYPFEDWVETLVAEEYSQSFRPMIRTSSYYYQDCLSDDPLDTAQRHDMRLYMLDDVLVKVDRMSMLNSLEVRSPLLDYRLVELALTIPSELRVKHGRNKYLLRRLAERKLPVASTQAPKRGFTFPLRKWLIAGEQSANLKELVCNSSIFNQDGGERFWNLVAENEALTGSLFRVCALELWLQGNDVRLN